MVFRHTTQNLEVEHTYFDPHRLSSMVIIKQDPLLLTGPKGARPRYALKTTHLVSFCMLSAQVDGIVLRAAFDGATLVGAEDIVMPEHESSVNLHILVCLCLIWVGDGLPNIHCAFIQVARL